MSCKRSTLSQLIAAAMVFAVQGITCGADWLTFPSTYTHDPSTGARVDQYASHAPAVSRVDPTYQESGYRQYRSTLQYGQAADNYHTVEKWGDTVRPYGEWRFPVRPYSAPYPAWGAPLAGMNAGGYYPGWPNGYVNPGFNGGGHPSGHAQPGFGGASLTPYPPTQAYPTPPYYDGAYPTYGDQPRMNDRQFFFKPRQ